MFLRGAATFLLVVLLAQLVLCAEDYYKVREHCKAFQVLL
jgi:hypothetical protein